MTEINVTCNLQMERETLQAVFWILCKFSMCPPFWCGRCQVSAYTHYSMSRPISETAAMIHLGSLGRSCGRDCRKARVLNIFP